MSEFNLVRLDAQGEQQTGANNCPNGGVCSFLLNISAWQNNPGEFKFAVFDKMTDGSLMAGYVVWTTP